MEECQLFNEENNIIYNNEFKYQINETKIQLIHSSEPSLLTKPILIHQIIGDSTLSPFTTLKGEIATIEDSSLLINKIKNENFNYSLISTSITPKTSIEELPFTNLQTIQPQLYNTKQQFGNILTRIGEQNSVNLNIFKHKVRKINGTLSSIQRENKDGNNMETQASATTMAEMACRLRSTKPIWALICDMAKTVYRSTILT
jgi:hypothetical protein